MNFIGRGVYIVFSNLYPPPPLLLIYVLYVAMK